MSSEFSTLSAPPVGKPHLKHLTCVPFAEASLLPLGSEPREREMLLIPNSPKCTQCFFKKWIPMAQSLAASKVWQNK